MLNTALTEAHVCVLNTVPTEEYVHEGPIDVMLCWAGYSPGHEFLAPFDKRRALLSEPRILIHTKNRACAHAYNCRISRSGTRRLNPSPLPGTRYIRGVRFSSCAKQVFAVPLSCFMSSSSVSSCAREGDLTVRETLEITARLRNTGSLKDAIAGCEEVTRVAEPQLSRPVSRVLHQRVQICTTVSVNIGTG